MVDDIDIRGTTTVNVWTGAIVSVEMEKIGDLFKGEGLRLKSANEEDYEEGQEVVQATNLTEK